MYVDIVIPNNNENEFIDMAKKLGYDSLCFVYGDLTKKIPDSDIKVYRGILASFKTINKLRTRADLTIMQETDDVRRAVEKARPDIIFSQEMSKRSDFIHQRNSGLNQIICKIAAEQGVAIGFSLKSIQDKRLQARVMGRMRQNIRLCRKYKVKNVIASLASSPYQMRSPHDITSLFVALGMHPKEAKNAMGLVRNLIDHNIKKRDPDFIADGVKIVD